MARSLYSYAKSTVRWTKETETDGLTAHSQPFKKYSRKCKWLSNIVTYLFMGYFKENQPNLKLLQNGPEIELKRAKNIYRKIIRIDHNIETRNRLKIDTKPLVKNFRLVKKYSFKKWPKRPKFESTKLVYVEIDRNLLKPNMNMNKYVVRIEDIVASVFYPCVHTPFFSKTQFFNFIVKRLNSLYCKYCFKATIFRP